MKVFRSIRFSILLPCLLALTVFAVPQAARAQQNWRATVGAESSDMGKQALAFLPNEIWVHADDSITWTWDSDVIHTLTFLSAEQPFPPFQVGCPGFSVGTATFDGHTCLTTPPMVKGQSITVHFPVAGNYKFECLVHFSMFGALHVLKVADPLPHNQDFYDDQAAEQRKALLSDIEVKMQMDHDGEHHDGFAVNVLPRKKHVIAGVGEISATPGGNQTGSLERFVDGTIEIHAGDTVEWSNHDPDEPHTITFGQEPPPANQFPPSPNVTFDDDGVGHAIISSPNDNVHSGFIEATLADIPGVPTNPIGPTRFRVTFTQPGTFNYICVLHDNLGMVGKVIVLP
jgi:plastocyanin